MPNFAIFILVLLSESVAAAQSGVASPRPAWLTKHFDYSAYTRLDAPAPPRPLIYQSNGFLALQEQGFGAQRMIVPVTGSAVPTNGSDRLDALEINAPVFKSASDRSYDFASSPAHRSITYFADRSVYRAAFDDGPEVRLTVFPIFGQPMAVLRVRAVRCEEPLRVAFNVQSDGFQAHSGHDARAISYGSPRWPYRAILAAHPRASMDARLRSMRWSSPTLLDSGRGAARI